MADPIVARTPAEKRALAERLAADYPEMLQWFRYCAEAFGPAAWVCVEIGEGDGVGENADAK